MRTVCNKDLDIIQSCVSRRMSVHMNDYCTVILWLSSFKDNVKRPLGYIEDHRENFSYGSKLIEFIIYFND